MPRQPTCACGVCRKCKHRVHSRNAYQAKSAEERREMVSRRDVDRVRAYDRERYSEPDAVARLVANTKQWRERHPDRARAQSKVAYAIRTGRLVKQPCEKCGSEERIHAHHDDYTKPLAVRWLCPLHHAEERRRQ